MPRQARVKSQSDIYHIMIRGINQQSIFEDEEDNKKFIETLKTYKATSGYKLFAYSLMSNHLHLLLRTEKESLDLIIKRISSSYVYWYNWKYYRRGHLFQDRFKSEPIEDEKYLLSALRYIHKNPVKAGLVKGVEEYPYSSYGCYIGSNDDSLVDTDFVLGMMSIEQFEQFHREATEDSHLDIKKPRFRLTDEQAKEIMMKVSKCKNASEFQLLDVEVRNSYIRRLREQGLSIRQISRMTGVSKGIVEPFKD